MPTVLLPLCSYLTSRLDDPTDISYIDSTKIGVCGNKRISRNKVFSGLGKIGKTTMGWFFGFKLHLITNEKGGLVAVKVTPGNTDDRAPVLKMSEKIKGKLFGDKGYISQKLFDQLFAKGIQLITTVKQNMKNKCDDRTKDVDKSIKRASMPCMLDLKDIFQLIIDALDHRAFAQY